MTKAETETALNEMTRDRNAKRNERDTLKKANDDAFELLSIVRDSHMSESNQERVFDIIADVLTD